MAMASDSTFRLSLVVLSLSASLFTGCATAEYFRDSGKAEAPSPRFAMEERSSNGQFDTQWKAAYALLEAGHYERCLDRIDQMETEWPNNRQVRLLKAEAYIAHEDYDLAAKLYRDLRDANPDDQELCQLYEVAVELSQTTRRVDADDTELEMATRQSPATTVK